MDRGVHSRHTGGVLDLGVDGAHALTTPPACGDDDAGQAIAPVANPQACFAGDDVPTFVCP